MTPVSNSKFKIQHSTLFFPPDHPLVRRELDALPPLLSYDGPAQRLAVIIAIAALAIAGFSCGCGGLLWQGLLFPLGLIPVIWSAQVISREVIGGRWDELRLTPYSVAEIVLAKLAAVVYRLWPLLALMLAVQVASGILSTGFSLVLTGNAFVYFNGMPLRTPEDSLFATGQGMLYLVMAGVLLITGAIQTVLDFGLTLAAGALASALTTSRPLAYLGALAGRGLASLLVLPIGLLAGMLLTGGPDRALLSLTLLLLSSSQGMLMLLLPGEVAGVLLAILVILGLEAGALVLLLRLAVWRAAARGG